MNCLITRNDSGDKAFITHAIKNRNQIVVYYSDYKKQINGNDYEKITPDAYYKNYLMKVSNHMNTDYPINDGGYKRDYYIIRDADSMYFSGYFECVKKSRLGIKGREAWLVELFVDKLIRNNAKGLVCIYMFSEDMRCWCQLNIDSFEWKHMPRIPSPNGVYTGFSSEPVSDYAIREILIL